MLITQIAKYALVGSLGLLIDFSITMFMKEKCSINKYLANSTGFIFAVVSNFLLNKYWTFQSDGPNPNRQFMFFFTAAMIGLLINNLVILVCNRKFSFNFYFSKILAVLIVFSWNFLINSLVTFN
jgi:putative flippase GtrA